MKVHEIIKEAPYNRPGSADFQNISSGPRTAPEITGKPVGRQPAPYKSTKRKQPDFLSIHQIPSAISIALKNKKTPANNPKRIQAYANAHFKFNNPGFYEYENELGDDFINKQIHIAQNHEWDGASDSIDVIHDHEEEIVPRLIKEFKAKFIKMWGRKNAKAIEDAMDLHVDYDYPDDKSSNKYEQKVNEFYDKIEDYFENDGATYNSQGHNITGAADVIRYEAYEEAQGRVKDEDIIEMEVIEQEEKIFNAYEKIISKYKLIR